MPATPKGLKIESAENSQPIVILFDWGDTLMVDYPDTSGKMCDWPTVEVVEGAEKTLRKLSKNARIYIATGAADSSEADIHAAFKRVGLDRYLAGYFCQANLGVAKGDEHFLPQILQRLNVQPEQVTMVGDNYDKDITPALTIGIKAIWLRRVDENQQSKPLQPQQQQLLSQVSALPEIIPLLSTIES